MHFLKKFREIKVQFQIRQLTSIFYHESNYFTSAYW